MRVCILGSGLSSLTLAKSLVNLNINVDLISSKKNIKINQNRTIGISENNIEYFNNHLINIEKITIPDISANRFKVKLSNKLAVFLMFIYTNQLYHFVSSNFCC